MLFHKHFQKLKTSFADIHPALSFLAFVIANGDTCFLCLFSPRIFGLSFENACSFLPQERGEIGFYVAEMLCFAFDEFECGDCSADIGDVYVMEWGLAFAEIRSNFEGLVSALLREGAWRLPAKNALDILLGLTVPGEQQSDLPNFLLHI